MQAQSISQVGAIVIALAGIGSATAAVLTGHIDAPTYIGIVGPVLGVGVGIGAHASGITAGAAAASGAQSLTSNDVATAVQSGVTLAPDPSAVQ